MRDERKSRNDPGVAQEWVDADSDEVMDAGEVVTYMAGPRGVECRIDNSGETPSFSWYLYDGLGSVLSEVDDEGNVKLATTKYDVYGSVNPSDVYGSTDSKHHFVGSIGHTTEPSTGGLIYMRARWYDPATGRFVSEDPAQDGVNWYGYCSNNPVNAVDPSGKYIVLPIVAGLFLLVALLVGVDAFVRSTAWLFKAWDGMGPNEQRSLWLWHLGLTAYKDEYGQERYKFRFGWEVLEEIMYETLDVEES